MRLAAGVEYCGTRFDGWQRQPGHRTVQECLETALSSVANHGIETYCAGRTDAGVHAVQQVVHFDTSSAREIHSWLFGVNSNLPGDVNLNWVLPVAEDFHARFSAQSRHYRYYLLNRPTRTAIFRNRITWELHRLDTGKMSDAAGVLVGEHDFTSFRAASCQSKTTVRKINRLEVTRDNDIVVIDIEANAFLHHMVRNIAGVLIAIGTGKQPVEWSREVLEARDRTLAGVTAPPDGLYLFDIKYPQMFRIPSVIESKTSLLELITGYRDSRHTS